MFAVLLFDDFRFALCLYTWSHIRNILQFVWMMRRCRRRRLQNGFVWRAHSVVTRTTNNPMQKAHMHATYACHFVSNSLSNQIQNTHTCIPVDGKKLE